MLPRRHRLTRPADYRAVLRGASGRRSRRRAGNDLLVVHAAVPRRTEDPDASLLQPSVDSEPTHRAPRVGFVVSGAVGGSVVRHRVVRRLRALVAPRLDQLPPGTDLVVRAQPGAAAASSATLGEALDNALARVLGARNAR